jgi:hypothetical protein
MRVPPALTWYFTGRLKFFLFIYFMRLIMIEQLEPLRTNVLSTGIWYGTLKVYEYIRLIMIHPLN